MSVEYNGKDANTPNYIKTQYDENGKIIPGSHYGGTRSGNSVLILGADLSITKTTLKEEYDLSGKEYNVKFELNPSLTNKDNNIKGIHLKITDTLPKGLTYGTGTCNYDEPEVTVNEDGSTTLVWYVYNCTVNVSIPSITYIAYIDKNTKDKTQYTSNVEIVEILNEGEKTKIGISQLEKRQAKNTIRINNSSNYSLYKTTTTPGIEENGTIHYKIVASNNTNTDLDTFRLLDKLPLEKDYYWITLQNVEVRKSNIQNGEEVSLDNTKILYSSTALVKPIESEETTLAETQPPTEEEEEPKEIPIEITDEDFGETSIWQEIKPGETMPISKVASAIAAKGVLEANTKIEIDIYLKTRGNKPKDSYKNKAIMQTNPEEILETVEVEARVVNRVIIGKIWEDFDRNGLVDYFEEYMKDVEVILYDATNIEIERTKTDEYGGYRFENLAEGSYKVKVVPPAGFYVTQKGAGGLLGINSKFNPSSNTTDKIELSATSESLSVLKYNINAGLYRERYRLHVSNYRMGTNLKIKNAIYTMVGDGVGFQGPEYKTDANGGFSVYLVPNQTYIMQQTYIAPFDYMLKEEPIIFSVVKVNGILKLQIQKGTIKTSNIVQAPNEGISDLYMEVENEPKYNIRITAYEAGTNHTISYARFRVKGKNMGAEGKIYQTNVNGIANIQSLELDQVYTVEEEYAKGYYYQGKQFTLKLTRNQGNLEIQYNGVETKEEPFIDEREDRPVVEIGLENVNIPKYTLELSKIGEKTGKQLANAYFEIEGEGRDETQEKKYVTNSNGTLTIEKLYENEIYTLKETVPPIGYKIKEEPLKFRATQENGVWSFETVEGEILEQAEIEDATIKIKYENELLFKLQKTDEETGKPLAGVKFTVKDLEGNEAKDLEGNPVGEIETINGKEQRVITTDEEGFYTAEIAQGLYKIEEVQTIYGYDLPENPIQYFGIDTSQEGKEGAVETWATEFVTDNSDIIERVAITSDGGRVFVGQIGGTVNTGGEVIGSDSSANYVMVKYNEEKKVVWQTTCSYGYINLVKETKDGGLLIVANSGIIKYGKNGEGYTLQWQSKVISEDLSAQRFRLAYIDETDDEGIIVAGQFDTDVTLADTTDTNLKSLKTKGATDIFVIKYEKRTATKYEVEWTTTIYGKTTNYVYITGVMATSDGGILVGGVTNGDITLPTGEVLTNTRTTDNTILLKYDKAPGKGYTFNWGKRINGDKNRITGMTETTDGEYVVAGYLSGTIQLSNRLVLNSNGDYDNLVVKYDKYGNIRFGFNIGGEGSELANHIDKMTDGGFAIAGSIASTVTLENGQTITPKGNRDAMIIRYDKDAHVKWAKSYGGTDVDYFPCLDINEEGRILLGTLFSSESFTLENGQVITGKRGNVDAALIEIQEVELQPAIPETREVNYQNSKHNYQITTKVEGTGGTITGENEEPFEQVKYTEDSKKDIIITPKEGYEVSSITVNGKEIDFIRNDDATVVLDKFTNIQEDKQVIVKFTANPAQVIVHHYILNTKVSLAPDEIIRGEVDKAYETTPKENIDNYEVEISKLPQNAKGTMTAEPIEVFYYYTRRDAKVVVHHYLDGTTDKLVEDEEIEGRIGSEYETTNSNIDGYEVVNEKWPQNSTGNMQEKETIVIYYYTKKEPKIITNTISKIGTKIIETEQQEVEYTLTYQAEISDTIGNAKIQIIDYLPFAIDEEKSNLDGGIYHEDKKTITWEDTIENINTYQKGNEKIKISKNISVVFKNMDYSQKNFINYANAKITIDEVEKETGKIPARTETNFRKNVKVTKKWNHTNNHYPLPKVVRYQLKQGEKVITQKDLTEENRVQNITLGENEDIWEWEFTNLEKYDEQGNEIDYQVEEVEVIEGDLAYYTKEINQESKTITNTYEGPIISSSKVATSERNLDYVVEGEKITYTITVQNEGKLEKEVVIKDAIPEGTSFVEGSIKINGETTQNTKENLLNGISINVPEKQEGVNGKATLSFEVTVNNLPEGSFENTIRNIAYVDEEPTPEETENQVKKSELKVVKESTPESGSKIKVGDKITYAIKVKNEGTRYGDIIIKDSIPEGTTFVENSIKINGENTNRTKEELGEGIILRVAEKQEVVVSFEVIVKDLEDGTIIKNQAYESKIPDKETKEEGPEKPEEPIEEKPTNETNNQYVEPKIRSKKEATSEKGLNYVVEGEKITYTITVENEGGLVKEVTVKDTIPEGTTFVEGSIKINGETTQNTKENLVNGIKVNIPEKQEETNGKATLSFEVTVNNLPEGSFENTIRNTAFIDDEPTPEEIENQVKKSSIKVTKESNPASGSKVKQGDKITYFIKLQNEGIVYGNVLVKDTIPEGTTFVKNSIKLNEQTLEKTEEDLTNGIIVRVPEKQGEIKGEAILSFEVIVNDINNMSKIKNVAYTTKIPDKSDIPINPDETDKPTNETENIYVKPIISSKKEATSEKGLNYVVEGEKITYTITVQNEGGLAKEVTIKDTIPEGTSFVEGSIKINGETTQNTKENLLNGISINVPEKQEGVNGKATLSFEVTVNNLPEGSFENTIRNIAYVDEEPTPEETENQVKKSELKVVKESTPESGSKIKVGDKITYAIKVKNEGTRYGDIIIKDSIPEGTTFVENSIKINGENTNRTKEELGEGIILRVAEKQEVVVSFEVIVKDLEDGTIIKNQAYESKIPDKETKEEGPEKPEEPIEEKPTNETNNQYVEPKIRSKKEATSEKGLNYVVEGEKITYTITVENEGGLVKEVTVKDTIPEGTTFVEGSIKINGETTQNTKENLVNGIKVNIPEKQEETNGKATLSFEVTVNNLPEGSFENTIRNTAFIDDEPTPEEIENQVKKSSIKVTKESNPASGTKVKQGDKITYTIKLQNEGTKYGDIIIKDTIPEGTTFVEGSIKINGEVVEKTAQDLVKGIILRIPEKENNKNGETTLSFEVTVNDIKDGTEIRNQAYTTKIPDKLTNKENPERPIDPSNPEEPIDPYNPDKPINTEEPTNETENIYIEPIITSNKTCETEKELNYVIEGEKITYTITVQNEGGLAKEVTIKDTIPEGTTFVEGSIKINGEITQNTKENLANGIKINVPEKQEETNGKVSLSFQVAVNKGTTGNLLNTAIVDDKPTNEVIYPVVTFEKQAEIRKVSEEEIPENTVTATDQIIYKIIVKNTGTINTQEIEVKDTIPEGTSIEQINNGGTLQDNKEIVWKIGEIRPNETKELSFVVKVKYAKEEKPIKNTAYINNEPTNETTTNYKKTNSKLTTKVTKTGDNQIVSTEQNIYYEINYTATIRDLKGKATITIVDELPYPIDEEKSNLSGGVYDAKRKTITWEKTEENIDTYKDDEEKNIQKTIAISLKYIYEDEENLNGIIENIVKATTQLKEPKIDNEKEYEIVKTEEKTDKHEVEAQIPAKVIIHHYINGTTTRLVEDETKDGKIGENYETAKSNKVAQNYRCISETPNNYKGKMTKTPIEVTYYYQLIDEIVNNEMTKTADCEVIKEEGNAICYDLSYQISIKDYIGKAKVVIKDQLPEEINLEKSDLAEGIYDEKTKTITWEEVIENINTFDNGTYETTIQKRINLVYEGREKIGILKNKAEGSIITYYPENYPIKPNEEKQTNTSKDENEIEKDYRTKVMVEKIWDDNENLKKHRPESIIIQLKDNKQNPLEEIVLSDENEWKHTFENLAKYDIRGGEIDYQIEEKEQKEGDLKYYTEPEILTTQETNTNKVIITNHYKLKDIEIDSQIKKEGSEEITNSKQEVEYQISYTATIKEYIGDVIVTIVDTLPYKIDIEKSDIKDGLYNEDTKTITWTKKFEDIDTTKNGDYRIKIDGNIKLVYKDLNAKEEKMTNEVKARIEFTEDETKNEVETSEDTNININGKIIVKYIDKETGKEITNPARPEETYGYEKEGKVGEQYRSYPIIIDGYDYDRNTGNTEGEIKEETQEIVFYYTKTPSGGVIIKYVDEEGKEIVPSTEIEGKIGDPYKAEEKELENYEFVETTGDEPEGEMTKEPKEVVYHYKRIPTSVIVKYLEKETGKELAKQETIEGYVGKEYVTERKVVEGYQKANPEPDNEKGIMTKEPQEVIYYYEKIPSGKVIVKYVDIETKEEIIYIDEEGQSKKYSYEKSGYVGEEYKTKEKIIPYYEYQNNVETSKKEGTYTQNDETITYYYRKLRFNISINKQIKSLSLDGNQVDIGKDGKMTKLELPKNKIGTANIEATYIINVSNIGELDGTASVYEMIPEGFTLQAYDANSWKIQEDNNLLMTLDLKAGESKDFEITLRWNNGEDNFGTKTNKVAIVKANNSANFKEITTVDNNSEATVILNIKTGRELKIGISMLGIILILSGTLILVQNKKFSKKLYKSEEK